MYSSVCTCMCVSCHDRAQPPVFVIVLAVPAVDLFYLSLFGKMWDGNIAKRMEETSHMKHDCFFCNGVGSVQSVDPDSPASSAF